MPYVTEELWAETAERRPGLLTLADWPQHDDEHLDGEAEAEMDWVVRLVGQVRSIRAEMRVPPGQAIPLILRNAGPVAQARLDRHGELIARLARLSSSKASDGDVPKGSIQDVLDEATIVLPLAGVIDIAGEKARLEKEIAKLDGEIGKLDKKLANQSFLAKAPAEVVEEQRRRLADTAAARTKLDEALVRLAAL
jgi:valyl-tRNA synthetase